MLRFQQGVGLWVVLTLVFALLAVTIDATAQLKLPRPSPNAEMSQTVGSTVIKVDYSRPGVKGREIWGKLVPYNEVWRAGANEATTISFSTDVTVNGKKLAAGTYSFFILPTPTEWTFIFNSEPKQWGAFSYNKDKDVLRIALKPESAPHQEWLSYTVEDLKSNAAKFVMRWEKLMAGVAIEVPQPGKDARPSPNASVSQTVGVTDMAVTYCRPGVKAREIWGRLEPFGKVWRAGANEATTVTFSDDVVIDGNKLAAGTYGFFILLNEKEWTFIFNSVAKQWGAFTYSQAKDVLRVAVKLETAAPQEWLAYSFDIVKSNTTMLTMGWEKMRASVKVEVDTTPAFVWKKVKDQVSAKMDDATLLNQGARYSLTTKQGTEDGMAWIKKSISLKKTYANLRTLAEFYAQAGKYADAITTGEEGIKVGKEQDPKLNSSALEKLITDWKSKK